MNKTCLLKGILSLSVMASASATAKMYCLSKYYHTRSPQTAHTCLTEGLSDDGCATITAHWGRQLKQIDDGWYFQEFSSYSYNEFGVLAVGQHPSGRSCEGLVESEKERADETAKADAKAAAKAAKKKNKK